MCTRLSMSHYRDQQPMATRFMRNKLPYTTQSSSFPSKRGPLKDAVFHYTSALNCWSIYIDYHFFEKPLMVPKDSKQEHAVASEAAAARSSESAIRHSHFSDWHYENQGASFWPASDSSLLPNWATNQEFCILAPLKCCQ
jgi:hypothetical protein